VSVFGVDGRRLRGLLHGVQPAGSHAMQWDGRDDRGARVPAGIYFLKLASASGSAARAIVKLN
jgi:flagellar hook assembly protein FlgD